MSHVRCSRTRGFALLEALIALVLILVGLVAVSQLQSISLIGAGEGRTRAEAAHLTQQRLEQLRNMLQKGEFTALADSAAPQTVNGVNAQFQTQWTVAAHAVPDARELRVWTTWTDSRGVAQRFDLATVVAWDESMSSAYPFAGSSGNPVAPTGAAERVAGLPDGLPKVTTNQDGSEIYRDPTSKVTYWTDGENVLMLPAKDGVAQDFTKIAGRILFDPDAGSNLPAPGEVLVRLSSEGECVYTTTGSLPTVTVGTKTFKYFTYTCYVGPGWYGNVGVTIDSAKDNTSICVGDSGFNGGLANGTTTSAHSDLSSTRTYRGFRTSATASGYQSTGVKGGTQFGTIGSTGPSAATSFANHDFLLTELKKTSCKTQMPTTLFAANAGAFVCITPDNLPDPVADQCPSTWPLTPPAGGGTVTYALTVTPSGNGAGNVTSDTGGIACGGNCQAAIAQNTVVVLTAVASSGSTFDGWTTCPSGDTGPTCTVTMSGDVSVGAIFNTGVVGTSYTLTVNKSGGGTVTGASGAVNCGSACSATLASGTSHTLTAVPDSGQTFLGWSGDVCNGSSATTCNVTMSANVTVQANFSQVPTSCTTTVKGVMIDKQGTVTASLTTPGTSCNSGVGGTADYSCTLVAPAGQSVTLRNERKNQYNKTITVTTVCPSATIGPNASTQFFP